VATWLTSGVFSRARHADITALAGKLAAGFATAGRFLRPRYREPLAGIAAFAGGLALTLALNAGGGESDVGASVGSPAAPIERSAPGAGELRPGQAEALPRLGPAEALPALAIPAPEPVRRVVAPEPKAGTAEPTPRRRATEPAAPAVAAPPPPAPAPPPLPGA
jgi:hypothetical protein